MSLFNNLTQRGLVKQTTSPEVESLLNGQAITFYCGFDPTADSLHIGSLLPLLVMKRLKEAGHKPLVILGSATSAIGDPSFKSQERVMLSQDVIAKNLLAIKNQIATILGEDTVFLENLDWFKNISFLDFLRDTGKSFTINSMIAKESVRARLEDRDQGISFTEFSYMLLQAHDFKHLFENHNCLLQIGGQDQWGNVVSGIELVRKTLQKEVFGLTFPLLIKSDGQKFGKSEKGNIWLDKDKTSAFDFFQFFMKVEDADIIDLLNKLSFLSLEEISSLTQATKDEPQKRLAQKALAEELTLLVHGSDALSEVQKQTNALFNSQADLSAAQADLQVTSEILGTKIIEVLVSIGLSASKSMARKDIQGNGIKVNGEKVSDTEMIISSELFVNSRMILSKGKGKHKVIDLI